MKSEENLSGSKSGKTFNHRQTWETVVFVLGSAGKYVTDGKSGNVTSGRRVKTCSQRPGRENMFPVGSAGNL